MRITCRFILLLYVGFSSGMVAGHEHIKMPLGEFYEYDIEGDRGERIRHEISFHTKQVIKAPFKAIGWCCYTSKSGLKKMSISIEQYLGASRGMNGRREELTYAMTEWEHYVGEHPGHEGDQKRFLFGLPEDAFAALRRILYAAGFEFPRATLQTVRRFLRGVNDCLYG
jgi:hypothetical protein